MPRREAVITGLGAISPCGSGTSVLWEHLTSGTQAFRDITIFDAKTITDNSGFKVGQHGIPTTGIPYVLVNGTIVVKDSEVLPVKPGQEVRFPVESKGRFEPIAVDGWLNQHTIGLNPDLIQVHLEDDSGAGELLHGDD